MSYCRFENTLGDVQDCLEAIENREIRSERENKNAKSMFTMFLHFCREEGIIEEYDMDIMVSVIDGATDTD